MIKMCNRENDFNDLALKTIMARDTERRPVVAGRAQRRRIHLCEATAHVSPSPGQMAHPAVLTAVARPQLGRLAYLRPIRWIRRLPFIEKRHSFQPKLVRLNICHPALRQVWNASSFQRRKQIRYRTRDQKPVLIQAIIRIAICHLTSMRQGNPQLNERSLPSRPSRHDHLLFQRRQLEPRLV